MGRVIAQEWISVDGLMAGPGGEGDVFAAAADDLAAFGAHNAAVLDSVGEILLGRGTYDIFRAFWPTAGGQPMADQINTLPKTVASTSLSAAPWGDHTPARVVADPVAHAHRRRSAGDGDTIVWGSSRLLRSLLAGGAVDVLELLIAPIALAVGVPLLPAGGRPVPLRLLETETWPGGTVRLRYGVRPGADRPGDTPG